MVQLMELQVQFNRGGDKEVFLKNYRESIHRVSRGSRLPRVSGMILFGKSPEDLIERTLQIASRYAKAKGKGYSARVS